MDFFLGTPLVFAPASVDAAFEFAGSVDAAGAASTAIVAVAASVDAADDAGTASAAIVAVDTAGAE